jgi:pyruvate formate lyase activating enzyme
MGSTSSMTRQDHAIKDYLPVSMLDWEGRVATVLFFGGCNFACSFCHNPELVRHPEKIKPIPFKDIQDYLTDKKGWIDGVVITGGEPTFTPGLKGMIQDIRSLGFPIKLDTNGSHPEILDDLLLDGLLDYVAMDIKSTFEKYANVTNSDIDAVRIEESINLIIRSNVQHEFRTTAYPGAVTRDDLIEIARYLGNMSASRYIVQQFRNDKVLDMKAKSTKPYGIEDLKEIVGVCNKYLPTILRCNNMAT